MSKRYFETLIQHIYVYIVRSLIRLLREVFASVMFSTKQSVEIERDRGREWKKSTERAKDLEWGEETETERERERPWEGGETVGEGGREINVLLLCSLNYKKNNEF